MRTFALALLLLAALLAPREAAAQGVTRLCFAPANAVGNSCQDVTAANPFPVNATATITFPTIGAAVPATGIYNSINVAGTLRGVTGLGLGSTFSQTVAIVDASGNQVTSFGGNATIISPLGSGLSATGVRTVEATDSPLIAAINSPVPAGTNTIGNFYQAGQYPAGAVVYSASATGTTGATTATLAASGGATTTFICGFSIRANATAAATGNATVTGTLSGTMNFTQWTAPAASGLGVSEMIFTPCYPASATNTAIAVISAAPGSGGAVSVTAWGYKL